MMWLELAYGNYGLFERSSEMIKKRTNRMVDALTAKIKHAGGSRNI